MLQAVMMAVGFAGGFGVAEWVRSPVRWRHGERRATSQVGCVLVRMFSFSLGVGPGEAGEVAQCALDEVRRHSIGKFPALQGWFFHRRGI
ncbi:MAG: hypothetical protein DDG60_05445 [Anaerolineae bacterium]|nr:MAG: hypothetical protein DDG60_05445 [Anaerolineae bacterium]